MLAGQPHRLGTSQRPLLRRVTSRRVSPTCALRTCRASHRGSVRSTWGIPEVGRPCTCVGVWEQDYNNNITTTWTETCRTCGTDWPHTHTFTTTLSQVITVVRTATITSRQPGSHNTATCTHLAPGRAGTLHGHSAARGLSAPPPRATLSRGPWLPAGQMAQGCGSRGAEGRRVGSEPPRDIILQPA